MLLQLLCRSSAGELAPCRPRVVHLGSHPLLARLPLRLFLARREQAGQCCDAMQLQAVHGRRRPLGALHLVRLASRGYALDSLEGPDSPSGLPELLRYRKKGAERRSPRANL